MVTTADQLRHLCAVLNAQREFAVDLEAHSYRTFQGLTCLMQISTREEDYVVDCLQLWHEMHILAEPFTNPAVLKVSSRKKCARCMEVFRCCTERTPM